MKLIIKSPLLTLNDLKLLGFLVKSTIRLNLILV
jgi:hypothetical protein